MSKPCGVQLVIFDFLRPLRYSSKQREKQFE